MGRTKGTFGTSSPKGSSFGCGGKISTKKKPTKKCK